MAKRKKVTKPTAALLEPTPWADLQKKIVRTKRAPRIKTLRRALGLTQLDFCYRYKVPIADLRKWEAGVTVPEMATKTYIYLIAKQPHFVAEALK